MTKVYPKAATDHVCVSESEPDEGAKKASSSSAAAAAAAAAAPVPVVQLTVWNKSLLPNCNGFTVFDVGQGNLVFRVDNYIAAPIKNKHQILLMDHAGKPLLTIRHKRGIISMGDNWMVFEGEESSKPIFTAKKYGNTKSTLAQVFKYQDQEVGCGSSSTNKKKKKKKKEVAYEIEGSYTQRCCTVYNTNNRRKIRTKVAEIKRKEAGSLSAGVANFGTDVFRLIVYPDMDMDMNMNMDMDTTTLAMAFVILLDHMFR